MRKLVLRPFVLAAVAFAGLGAAVAYAIELRIDNIVINADGGFTPTALPKHENAPIKLYGHAKFSTIDGTRPSPLTKLLIEFDKHGAVETRGLQKCTMRKLDPSTTERARKICKAAIVGKGFGTALIILPDSRPIKASTPITLFNGPVKHGNPTVIGHGFLSYPLPTTYLVPIEIQKINNGRYGFRTVAEFPKIANYYGSALYGRLKIGREWRYKGKTLSYANAHCPDGRLQARGEFSFKDGNSVEGTLFRPCTVAPK